VKWKLCTRPKRHRGLEIKNLDTFGRDLKMHWLWHNWDVVDRPWKKLLKYQPRQDGSGAVLCLNGYDGGRRKEHAILGIVMVERSLP
jgi:hypothetical protein